MTTDKAKEIINGPVSDMCVPLGKLKAIAELLTVAFESKIDLEVDRLQSLGDLIHDYVVDLEKLWEEAHALLPGKEVQS